LKKRQKIWLILNYNNLNICKFSKKEYNSSMFRSKKYTTFSEIEKVTDKISFISNFDNRNWESWTIVILNDNRKIGSMLYTKEKNINWNKYYEYTNISILEKYRGFWFWKKLYEIWLNLLQRSWYEGIFLNKDLIMNPNGINGIQKYFNIQENPEFYLITIKK